MKTVRQIVDVVERRLTSDMFRLEPRLPMTIPIGLPGRADLETNVVAVHDNNNEIRTWARRHGCPVETVVRTIGTPVELISHVIIPDEQTALRVSGNALAARYRSARKRYGTVRETFPIDEETAMQAVRLAKDETDVDFALLLQVAGYCASHDVAGLRPRAVPLAGFSAKWLDRKAAKRRKVVELLSGKPSLELDDRPRELRFRHLDPTRALQPDVVAIRPWDDGAKMSIRHVVIVENKDTYQLMPPISDGLCVFGSGKAAVDGLALLPWLFDERSTNVRVLYWGDMDAAGFEILSSVRQLGVDCDSLFMDRAAYNRYGMFGTNLDQDDKPLSRQVPKPLPGLRDGERELYEALCTGEGVPYLRLEQERIPIADAAQALSAIGFPVAGQVAAEGQGAVG
ncbi:hypothetical protein D2E25_0018 [Bifidobacterium goeldii]|uniref:Wadjet protein JetD C-terminal domain-containing protein n=1 Tax=Bifidobacterium goeldii TaxID=2306975 RepID=A0A430FLY6_9BIFI|nr:DUF3322 and DUF2220 domain-containing protein [Bifidobacterium goeldii]RSX53712.1 hypothetical protein D2E25_0018 [Bifidobacterium goeldii]